MDLLREIFGRIQRRLDALDITGNAASIEAGRPDAIRNIRRAIDDGDRRGISTETVAALVPALHTTLEWLVAGVGLEDPDQAPTIPVWGKAGAGGKVYNHGQGPIGRIQAPADANDKTGAVEIDGESLGKVWDGWYAIYDDVRDPPTDDMIGTLCVVEDEGGQVLIKRLKKGRGRSFTLESSEEPIYDVKIKWVARVKNVIPP